ncbi:MAG TPA: hypothetical protein VFY43_00835, partial [Candidatus Limnocylindria bacterium]|nr:hypothetical protein [Candidatus Limnocylindria bacterium]
MTNLLNDRELDRVLDTWLDEGPARVSDLVIDGALGRIPTTRQRPVRRAYLPPALRTRAVTMPLVVAAVIAFVTLLGLLRVIQNVGPMPSASPTASASQPAPSALPTEVPSAASGRARIEVSGAAQFTEEWGFIRAEAIERYPGLRLYQFYELASTPCECPGGKYLDVHLDPNDPSAYPLGTPVPTSEELILRFGFVDDVYVDDDYVNGHVSMDGECRVTFTAFTEREIEATYECVDVPSETNQQLVNVVGTFSFDPREVTPEENFPSGAEIEIAGSTSPERGGQWQYGGCQLNDETQVRYCRFTDGFHRLELWGVLDPALDPSRMTTADDRLRVEIYWFDSRTGEIGEYESVSGECVAEFQVLTETRAVGSVD